MTDLLAVKRDLRRQMEEKRAQLFQNNPDAPLQLRDLFLRKINIPAGSCVAFYHPRGSELNPMPLATILHNHKQKLALPVVTGRGKPMIFRAYEIGDKLQPGALGIMEPPTDALAVEPDIFVVPLLAFDLRGHRLGYGGGYYDRTLREFRSQKKITAIGIGFNGQEVPELPAGPYDAQLDKIVTETRVVECALP